MKETTTISFNFGDEHRFDMVQGTADSTDVQPDSWSKLNVRGCHFSVSWLWRSPKAAADPRAVDLIREESAE